jgi:hypothetical protein
MLSLFSFVAVLGALDVVALRWGTDSRHDDERRNW